MSHKKSCRYKPYRSHVLKSIYIRTPLHFACLNENFNVLSLLLNLGADPNIPNDVLDVFFTFQHLFISFVKKEIPKLQKPY